MHGRVLFILLLLGISTAHAQQSAHLVVRCQKGKEISVQNVPCEPGWKEIKAVIYANPTESERARRELQATRREIARRNAAMRQSGHTTPSRRSPDYLDCQNARAYVDRVRREIGSQRLTRAKSLELCQIERDACGWCR